MGFQIETAAVDEIGRGDYVQVSEGVYVDQSTGAVCMVNREGTVALLVKPL
jgi:hypothetical protein